MALSALLWRGEPYRLLEAIRERSDIRLFSSPVLLAELADVRSRPSPAKQLAIIGRAPREVLADYIEIVEVVEPDEVPRVVPGDADDDHVIAAAITASATLIVWGDSDLFSMGSHQGIDIVSAAMAMEQISGEDAGSKI